MAFSNGWWLHNIHNGALHLSSIWDANISKIFYIFLQKLAKTLSELNNGLPSAAAMDSSPFISEFLLFLQLKVLIRTGNLSVALVPPNASRCHVPVNTGIHMFCTPNWKWVSLSASAPALMPHTRCSLHPPLSFTPASICTQLQKRHTIFLQVNTPEHLCSRFSWLAVWHPAFCHISFQYRYRISIHAFFIRHCVRWVTSSSIV